MPPKPPEVRLWYWYTVKNDSVIGRANRRAPAPNPPKEPRVLTATFVPLRFHASVGAKRRGDAGVPHGSFQEAARFSQKQRQAAREVNPGSPVMTAGENAAERFAQRSYLLERSRLLRKHGAGRTAKRSAPGKQAVKVARVSAAVLAKAASAPPPATVRMGAASFPSVAPEPRVRLC